MKRGSSFIGVILFFVFLVLWAILLSIYAGGGYKIEPEPGLDTMARDTSSQNLEKVVCVHTKTELTNQSDATCTQCGYTGDVVCVYCGEIQSYGEQVPMIDHMPATVNAKEPSCEEDGYTGDVHCSACGLIIESGTIIPATGHNVELYNVKEPTCTSEGYSGDEVCTKCEKTVKHGDIIPLLEHTPGGITGYNAPTCTKSGYSGDIYCTVCNQKISVGSVLPATGHIHLETRGYKAATIDAAGYSGDKYCKDCGMLVSKGSTIARIISNDDKKGTYDWEYTHNARYPLTYNDETLSIKIDKVWYHRAWCYVAQVKITDYTRFYTYCANGKYGGTSSTTKAAKQNNAILATNGCYSAPSVGNVTVRRGVIYNGGPAKCNSPVVYSSVTGLMGSAAMLGANAMPLSEAVAQGLITDTFCFGPAFNMNGKNNDGGSAQRTTIGTNGKPGEFVLVVSEGRYSDGVSAGLNYQECCDVIKHFGCIYGAPLDGGGSSTMVFQGEILNHVKTERGWLVDFCIIK